MKWYRPRSLTAGLGWVFALVTALTLASVGTYLHRSLAQQLIAHDDRDLLGKINQIRHLLTETSSSRHIREDPHRFADTAAGHEGLILILKSADGAILFQNHAEAGMLPELAMTPANLAPTVESIQSWTLTSGSTARILAAWGMLDGQREQVQIAVARTASDREALLAAYRSRIYVAVGAGALLSALLGYVLLRYGLSSVRNLAKQAQSITAQRLDTRIDVASAPLELQTFIQSFNGMLDRLHNSFQRLSQFSADLAHDLRTPINNLMVQTQVALSKQRTSEDYQMLLASNVEEYERLSRMVESMLFLARADHAELVPNKQALDLSLELQRIADYFEDVAEDRGVRINVQADDTIFADGVMFRRAVNNLVANAIRYTPKGKWIQLISTAAEKTVTVSVINPGPGINPNDLPRLFDRFYRADQARTDSALLAGLGLAIVQSIMSLHAGHAEVESIPDGVTSFHLHFPRGDKTSKKNQLKL